MMDIEQRIINEKAKQIFTLIRKQGVVSKTDLLQQCGMTVSTLTRILEELGSLELIQEAGSGVSTGGRRPILYRMNPKYAYTFGLDISRTACRLVLCNMLLHKIDEKIVAMTESTTPDVLIEQIVIHTLNMIKQHHIDKSSVLGMGIGAVGPLSREDGIILNPKYFPAPGWKDVPICTILFEKLGFPILLDNGANTALLGEFWNDPNGAFRHLLYVHAGIGIRSAMIVDGRIVYGAVDMEGAAGQMIIQANGVRHRELHGNRGSWESYASIYAIEQTAQKPTIFRELLDALAGNDPVVTRSFSKAATYFGIGLANLLNILHPEKVILGGPLFTNSDLFFQTAIQTAIKKTYHIPAYQVSFNKSMLGDGGVAIGAAAMVINRISE